MRLIVGGGNGLEATLEAIGDSKDNIIAFTVVDSGGDVGTIRKEYPDVIPVGDVKKIIWGLKKSIKFDFITTYNNHKYWNVLVFELIHKLGPNKGLDYLRNIFEIKSKIYPISLQPTDLYAKLENETIKGEHIIENIKEKIYDVWLNPQIELNPSLKDADFDTVILGPGSIYGSQISNLLVKGFSELIQSKRKILIVNGTKRFDYITTVDEYVKEFTKYGYNPNIIIAPESMKGNADFFVKTINGKYDIQGLHSALEGVL